MDLKNLFEADGDERAVSPVIGVILMVAITVILAAVIGAFVIGIGEDQEVQPTASFDVDFDSDQITVTHSTGDTISDPDGIDIVIEGEDEEWIGDGDITSISSGNTADIFAEEGESSPDLPGDLGDGQYAIAHDDDDESDAEDFNQAIAIVDQDGDEIDDATDFEDPAVFDYNGKTVSIVWSSESGDSSATLSSQDAPT